MLGVYLFGEIIMPLWKHLFTTASSIIGGAVFIYFANRFERTTKLDTEKVRDLKKHTIYAPALIALVVLSWVIEIGDENIRYDRAVIFNSIATAVGIGYYFLVRYLLRKEQSKTP
jgi:hypothetical protein